MAKKEYQVTYSVTYSIEADNEDEAYQEAEERFREDWESGINGINEMFSVNVEEVRSDGKH
ncbi:hypothetical protein ES702_03018 [subsurface metagenome]